MRLLVFNGVFDFTNMLYAFLQAFAFDREALEVRKKDSSPKGKEGGRDS